MTARKIIKRPPLVEFPHDEMLELISKFTPEKLASFLDVTDLKADTLSPKINEMVETAVSLGCPSICVNPVEVDILPKLLKGKNIKECYVIDFPLGKLDIEMKHALTKHTVEKSRSIRGEGKGKIELDMVINVGRFKNDIESSYTMEEIEAIVEAADGEHVKVIVRSSELNEKELYKVSEIVAESSAHFIKNSTGMDAYGALPEHLRIMREIVGNEKGVKGAGGVSDAMSAMRLFYAAAKDESLHDNEKFRLGTSAPLNIVSSMKELLLNPDDALKAKFSPCSICPYSHKAKLNNKLIKESEEHCIKCKYKP